MSLDRELVEQDRLAPQEFGVLGRGDDEQPLAEPAQPGHLADHHLDVAPFLLAVQVAGE